MLYEVISEISTSSPSLLLDVVVVTVVVSPSSVLVVVVVVVSPSLTVVVVSELLLIEHPAITSAMIVARPNVAVFLCFIYRLTLNPNKKDLPRNAEEVVHA